MSVTVLARCEGRRHAEGVDGHHGPAAFRVHTQCPRCPYTADTALCAGRVADGRATPRNMECPECHYVGRWHEFWRTVDPLEPSRPRSRTSTSARTPGVRGGGNPPPAAVPALEPVRAEDLLDRWRQHLQAAGRRATTIDLRFRYLRRFAHEHPDLLAVTRRDLEGALSGARATMGPAALKSYRNSLAGFYRWALREQLVAADPTATLAPIHVPPTRGRTAEDASIRAALARANPSQRAMILLARYGGLRRAEIATLHTRDRDGDRIRVDGKGGRVRSILLQADLRTALEALEAEQGAGPYFPGRIDGHVSFDTVHRVITQLVGINPHALRHAAATAAYRQTKDLQAVQEFLGHASLATTQLYLHVSEAQMRAVADATRLEP